MIDIGLKAAATLRNPATVLDHLTLEVLDEVNAIDLALIVDCVVAIQRDDQAFFLKLFELVNLVSKVAILHVLCVPLWNLVELKQVTELHLLLLTLNQCISVGTCVRLPPQYACPLSVIAT